MCEWECILFPCTADTNGVVAGHPEVGKCLLGLNSLSPQTYIS